MKVPTNILMNALTDGAILEATIHEKTIPRRLTVLKIGTLKVRSGKLIAGDLGMTFQMADPFVRQVPPGEYDVFVSVWGLKGIWKRPSDGMGDTPRAAYLSLAISNEQPTKFEFASSGDKDICWVPESDNDGFGVDVGPVGLIDADDLATIEGICDHDDFIELASLAYKSQPKYRGTAGIVSLPTSPPIDVPTSESGWGDGGYFSYWGLNNSDEPIVLIVDFDLDGKFQQYS